MKYAVIRVGGKQYKVHEGDVLDVEHIADSVVAKQVTFSDVLLFADGDTILIGKPIANGVTVVGTVQAHLKGEKIYVQKFKAKVRHRRRTGHRQSLSKIAITNIAYQEGIKKQEANKPKKSASKKTA